jgi:two-component system phosphate regulon sensor histidine kinase PhoR
MISEETKVLGSLVNEVLTAFRLDNVPVVEKSDIEIHKLLKEVCKVHFPKLNESQSEVHYDFKAGNDVVLGNYNHLFNTFSNLVDNAIKYRKGQLCLNISTQNTDNGIEIRVSDNGIGISKDNLPLIFEPFVRFNTDDAHYVKGFGLGLNYVKHVVEYHKGTVKVKSELDKGTTFIICLPLKNK